jgi:AraC family transcriptional regulator
MEIQTLEAQPMLTIRVTTTDVAATLAELFGEVWNYLQAAGVEPAGPPFTIYHRVDQSEMEIEAGLPVGQPVAGRGRIQAGSLPGGLTAIAWHVGPYETLAETYTALHVWLQTQARTPAGPPYEIYWTDPGEEPDPAKWRTEIRQPVR